MNAKDRRELVAAVGALNSADLIGLSQGLLTLACELPSKGEMQFFAQELMGAVNAELDQFAKRFSKAVEREGAPAAPGRGAGA